METGDRIVFCCLHLRLLPSPHSTTPPVQTTATMPAPDLLHDALRRATSRSRNAQDPALSPTLRDFHLGSDDDEQIEVRTPLPSYPGSVASSAASSRSTSPTRAAAGRKSKGGGKPRRDKAKEQAKAEAMKNPFDPFLRFPGEVLGRVLGGLGAEDLLAVGLVCKRWKRSQTLSVSLLSHRLTRREIVVDPPPRERVTDFFSSLFSPSRRLHLVPPPAVPHLRHSRRAQDDLRRLERCPDLARLRGQGGLGRALRQHLPAGRSRGGGVGA